MNDKSPLAGFLHLLAELTLILVVAAVFGLFILLAGSSRIAGL